MVRVRAFRIVLALIGLIVLPALGAFAQNLAPNPSFESGNATAADSWAPCHTSGTVAFSITTSTVHTGARAVRMDVTQTGDTGYCSVRTSITPNQGYAVSAWLKAPLGRQAALRVIEWGSDLSVQADKTVAVSSGETSDWEFVEGAFTTGANTRLIEIRLMHSVPGVAGTGTFYWDDASLGTITGVFDASRLGNCPAAQSPPACTEANSVGQWKCWQKTLKSSGYEGVNAYRDLELTVEYRNTATNAVVRTGWGFWDCRASNGNEVFRIRTALPALAGGTYTWETRCRLRTGAPAGIKNCATDKSLNGPGYVTGGTAKGTFTVTSATVNNDRYDRGFLTLSANKKFLKQGSTTVPFFWLADTAWAAVNAPRTGDWPTYLDKRSKQGFSVLLFDTAPAFGGVTEAAAFQKMDHCTDTGQVPNSCSRWMPPYWQQYEAKVLDANAKGMVVVVAGVMEPFSYGPARYGDPQWVSIFARNLAARLSGHHVIFSPGSDNPLTATAQTLVASVGPTMDQAVPAHLLTYHAGGGSVCTDYTSNFQAQTWHDFHLFQSGHCKNGQSTAPPQQNACEGRRDYAGETKEACVTRRAAGMSFVLYGNATAKPVVNGEAVYDSDPAHQSATISPDNRDFLRQTGYLSTLSGSFGFTYGSNYFSAWQVQSGTLASQLGPVPSTVGMVPAAAAHSGWDIQRLASIFRGRPWKELVPEPARILIQPAADDKKMAYAHTSNYVYNLAYLPNHPAAGGDPGNTKIRLDLSQLTPAFNCTGTDSHNSAIWTAMWMDPKSNAAVTALPALCQPASGGFEFTKPLSCPRCEWVLAIDRVGASSTGLVAAESTPKLLQLWPDQTDGASSLSGKVLDSSGNDLSGVVSLSQAGGKQFNRKEPRMARDSNGNFFTVWESEYQDGSLWGVFGRKLDPDGQPLGDEFQVNTTTDQDQAEPAVATSAAGTAVVVWMSFDQDGDRGGIYGQLFDTDGFPDNHEFQVNTTTAGHQGSPLVGMSDSGTFVVAWDSEGQNGEDLGIFAQRFNALGQPAGSEIQVTPGSAGDQVLANLEVDAAGGFVVSWFDYDPAGDLIGVVSHSYDNMGQPQN